MGVVAIFLVMCSTTRATSHTRLRARDHYSSSTLVGGKGGAGPTSLHTSLKGPMEYVNARWLQSLHGFLHGIERIMFHGHLAFFPKPSLGDRLDTKLGDHGTLNAHNHWFILLYRAWGPTWTKFHRKHILVEISVTYDFMLHLRVRDHTTWFWRCGWDNLWILSSGLSQFHGHGPWLMCEVALIILYRCT